MNPSTRAKLVLLSGGLDSVVLAYSLARDHQDLRALYFNMGGTKTLPELSAAKFVARQLRIPLEVADLASLKQLFIGYVPENVILVEGGDTVDPKPADLHPYARNPTAAPILHSIGLYYARVVGCSSVCLGYIASQLATYPGLAEYLRMMPECEARLNQSEGPIAIEAPFLQLAKRQVVKLGADLGAPLFSTWSCATAETVHCGSCYACLERRQAFVDAELKDETTYRHPG